MLPVASQSVVATLDQVREIRDADRPQLGRLIEREPLLNAAAAHLFDAGGGRFLGAWHGGRLSAGCLLGATILPLGGDATAWESLAAHLAATRPGCSSLVGRDAAVDTIATALSHAWRPPRLVRCSQPLLVTAAAAPMEPDPGMHAVAPSALPVYLPAAAAMYAEELGMPDAGPYRRRIAALVAAGRAFARVDGSGVAVKAEIGVVTRHTAQVQGVWVRPDLRGQGVGTAAMAAVIRAGLALAPTVSLYVNDGNAVARRLYSRLGMRQVATMATVIW